MKQMIGDFLLRRLEEAGVAQIFGVPGDYNLEFMQQLEDRGHPEWIGNCNELNASYAADGYARLKGLGALIVTNGVGALSAINGVAGAYCERVPIICICGSLPMHALARGTMMHHTLADGGHGNFLRAFEQVTVAQSQLTPQNAASEIDRLIITAWQNKLPVYLELPSDIAYLEISVPEERLVLSYPDSDAERLDTCATAIVKRLQTARSPAFLLDLEAERYGVVGEIMALAEKLQAPIAVVGTSKGIINEGSPLYVGTYSGAVSGPAVKDAIEKSDCLFAVGYRRIDSTSGFFTDALPSDTLKLNAFASDISGEYYEGVWLKSLLERVTSDLASAERRGSLVRQQMKKHDAFDLSDEPLCQKDYWALIQDFIRPGDVILAEDGTSSSGGSHLILPEDCTFITQAIWGSIGYTLASLLGTLKAAPERRHLLFIGDGSFQLTAQEISTMLRHDLKPYIFLINNRGYTIERTILGARARYNDVADWQYHKLAQVLCRKPVVSHLVSTSRELAEVLNNAPDDFLFVESVMDSQDALVGLIRGGHASADVDYGPRGPQRRPGIQIPVPR